MTSSSSPSCASASSRVDRVLRHLDASGASSSSSSSSSLSSGRVGGVRGDKDDGDVLVVSCVRTAVCKAARGLLASTSAVTLLDAVLREAVRRAGVDGGAVNDVCVGTVLAPGSTRANDARIAALLAGLPHTTSVRTVNRQCSSGLQAIADVAAAIRAGFIEVGIGAGVETMTSDAMPSSGGGGGARIDEAVRRHAAARACLIPMGITSENVAAKFAVSRDAQDRVAAMSHARAAAAAAAGRFQAEIVPVRTVVQQRDTGALRALTVDADDGVRANTTVAALAKLPAVFKKNGSTTAGNSSQISDGAAAAVLMSRGTARKLGVKRHLGVLRSYAVVGVPPEIMGIGPAVAIPRAVEQAGLRLADIDLFEINEAFASQATYCVDKLGLSWDRVNVNGGAIALGHPLGCTGVRMSATLLHEMQRRRVRYGVVSMCIGSGMGAAAVYEAEY